MNTSPIAHVRAEQLECEFIPPLDARDTWGLPWDQQLDAARAWQQAGGNEDSLEQQWAAQANLAALKQISPRRTSSTAKRSAANDDSEWVERRRHAISIDFADRRRAG